MSRFANSTAHERAPHDRRGVPRFRAGLTAVAVALAAMVALPAGVFAVERSIPGFSTVVEEDFDSLGNTTATDQTALPVGWALAETGTGANGAYRGGTGSANSGDTYSFGAADSTERAFGGLRSGSLIPTIGASFSNDTGGTITSLDLAYTGEQWRAGIANRGAADRLDFQYSLDATSLTSGNWTDVDALDFASPQTSVTTLGALDGNLAANQADIASTISSLSVADGATIWIRWLDFDIPNSDDGLAIDDFSLTANGVPGDAAPEVASTDPADDETEVPLDSDISITFSEPVDVADGWYSIACEDTGTHPATATDSGDATTYTLDPDTDFGFAETCTVTIDGDSVNDQDTDDPPDEMAADHVFSFETIGDVCEDPFTPIYDIQGDDDTSPLTGQTASTRGVVTGDFVATDGTGLSGFFIQDPDGDEDATTSDGLFVFVPSANEFANANLDVGDEVHLRGRVVEFNTQTQIDFVDILEVCSTSNVIDPTPVTLPAPVNGDLERYEGMLINIEQEMTVGQNFFLGRYGQLSLSSQGRLYQPTNSLEPGSPEFEAERDLNARRLLILDDGRDGFFGQNPDPIPYIGRNRTIRAGDTVQSLTGNLDFGQISSSSSIRDYRLHPAVEPQFERVNHRRPRPPQLRGDVTVASFNVLNYFTTLRDDDLDARGADNEEEFERQKAKIVEAIVAIDADVVGLIEIENNDDVAVQDLVDGLNDEYGSEVYAAVAEPATGAGSDAIRQALIYKPATLELVGDSLGDTDAAHDRPPIAQTFNHPRTGQAFSVIVNHFKSKSCGEAQGLDEDQGDGQACYNARRVDQAEALIDFIDEVTTAAGDEDVLVIGDLNAYGAEDPIDVLREAGLVDLLARFNEDPYTFIFDGQSGYLDHALSSASLIQRVTGAQEWHINADEPSVIDYNTEFKPQDLYRPNAFRSSDHDPVILGLRLGRASPAYPRNAQSND